MSHLQALKNCNSTSSLNMLSVLPSGALGLDDVRQVLLKKTEWRLSEDLMEKAKDKALAFTTDSALPLDLQASNPIARLAILLAAGSSASSDSGAVIGLSLVNLFNSLPAAPLAGEATSPFHSTLFDLTTSSSLTDASFSDALVAVLAGVDIQPADALLLHRPFITTAILLATTALSEKLWDYVALVLGIYGELQGAAVLQTGTYSRENAPLYLSLTIQRVDEIVHDSQLLAKTGSDFLVQVSHVLAPLLSVIANVRNLIAKSAQNYFEVYGLQTVIASLSSAILLIVKFIASIQKTEAPTDVPLYGLSLVLADHLANLFNSFLSPKIIERQAGLPSGKQLVFGLVTREFVKSVTASGIASLVSLPIFKAPEGVKHEVYKEPSGTRDLQPVQMQVRDRVINLVTSVFKRHGSVSIETPVFELREVLFGKYGEEGGKLIYDLADQGGELLSLRYDLTVPFARYLATHNESSMKRYQIAKVYRRDKAQVEKGRFREFYQCDFDIAGPSDPMIADAEVISVFAEILEAIGGLCHFDYEIQLSHRGLLALLISIAGVPAEKFRPVCSSIDKLDKVSWDEVRSELINLRGLRPESADKLGEYLHLSGPPEETLGKLRAKLTAEYEGRENGKTEFDQNVEPLLHELSLLFDYIKELKVIDKVKFYLALARGLDYYTGLIFEAVALDQEIGSIAGGGRYDELVGMFSGKKVPAVGGSVGIERVFALIEEKLAKTVRAVDTQVFICSLAQDFTKERLAIASELWAENIAAELLYKAKPGAKVQFGQAAKSGAKLAVTVAPDEIANGTLKIKVLAEEREITVARADLISTVKQLLTEIH
jgi:histidyl-tRNA synthetase